MKDREFLLQLTDRMVMRHGESVGSHMIALLYTIACNTAVEQETIDLKSYKYPHQRAQE